MLYSIAIEMKDNMYFGNFPDIKGLKVTASSIAEIISIAQQSVIEHLNNLIIKKETLPEASDINKHLLREEYAGCTWAIINIDTNRIIEEEIELIIDIPKHLHKKIQKLTDNKNLDINTFIISAIQDKIL